MYETRIIQCKEEINQCQQFHVDHLLWGTTCIYQTSGRLGFIPEKGFVLQMICNEANPVATCHDDKGQVCFDSAMEAFFQFFPPCANSDEPLPYLNLEINSAGALHAKYGVRPNRNYLPLGSPDGITHQVEIKKDCWQVEVFLPLTMLEKIYGPLHLCEGSHFTCNFYKVAENPAIEHYASFFPIPTNKPNFHLPEYFENSILVKSK